MTKSYLLHRYTQFAATIGHIISPGSFGAAALLTLVLTLATTVLPGIGQVYAQNAAPPQAVNINSANAETLATGLRGIGHSRAMEIVRYREAYGPFTSVDELTEVKGIGQSTLDENRAVITLE
jgi:competence protein ComEA